MCNTRRQNFFGAAAAVVVAVVVALAIAQRGQSWAAPVPAVITPVGGVVPATSDVSILTRWSDTVEADGRFCRDTREWVSADFSTAIVMTAINTTTVSLSHSDNNQNFEPGSVLVSAATTTTNALNRYDLFGAFTCIEWTLATDDPVTIEVLGLFRR